MIFLKPAISDSPRALPEKYTSKICLEGSALLSPVLLMTPSDPADHVCPWAPATGFCQSISQLPRLHHSLSCSTPKHLNMVFGVF
ncbi:hypothetical protein F3Y22_tig00003721pilonHSYRG00367 [Hibiscus syriacus]|uniref:Uncharacterized protein n=1 Tax=Hibiscus syriacus TaxID=106335 RepID=A0A6A3CPY2_HIBSY|nr:hypothetical protein F3Y22_tig00003721pilonHSYRG00367 [Hibiscus syriacus]